jgi:hypothetical protein
MWVFAGNAGNSKPEEVEISYSGWIENATDSNLYERQVSIYKWTSPPITINLKIQTRRRLKNLDAKSLERLTWLSKTTLKIKAEQLGADEVTQFFRYDPTQDVPRDLDFYEVKTQAVK